MLLDESLGDDEDNTSVVDPEEAIENVGDEEFEEFNLTNEDASVEEIEEERKLWRNLPPKIRCKYLEDLNII